MDKVNSKNVIITGAASGIGLACARLFAVNGYTVFGLDVSKLQHSIENFQLLTCDVSNPQQLKQVVDQIATKAAIKALVCSAGVHLSATIEETSEQDFARVVGINFAGCFFAIQTVLPYMKEQGGAMVLVGSDQSLIGKQHSAVYGASKAAIAHLAKTTALDYAEFGIRVNCVCPGTIDTPMYREAIKKYAAAEGLELAQVEAEEAAMQPLNRIGTADEVANLIYFLASDQAGFVTGSLYPIDGGYTAG